jgi:alkyl sulfatase BDS1-like metallo-beta-lactamase superfamily hydrolase
MDYKTKAPTGYTREQNEKLAKELGIDLQHPYNEELDLAKSHCLKSCEGLKIYRENGEEIYDQGEYRFLKEEAVPDSVNPSLWLNGKGLYECGVYSVVGEDVIQVRGFDIANINLIRGKTKWIVLDTGSSVEGMEAAVKAVEEYLGEPIQNQITAAIISHSHGDHFGGLQFVTKHNPDVQIYVPKGFEEATRDEYVYAGKAMKARALYQMGTGVAPGAEGKISVGCGLASVPGTPSYAAPTYEVKEDETIEIDGIHVDFQITNETEAVSNMQNYFQEYKALWVADNCIGTLHNIYTMRGAKVRDALLWAQALYDTAVKYGDKAEVIFQGHSWPHWNTEENPNAVKDVLLNHAAVYKNIHDQTLAAVAKGVKMDELKSEVHIPQELQNVWYLRPYYGTYETNIRAVFQKYLGFYDGNPIHLNPSTEKQFAWKLISYVGSKEKIVEKARVDFAQGEYQLVAEMTGYVLQVSPEYTDARELCADALEQIAYQTESAIWRNGYLKAVRELRSTSISYPGIDEEVLSVLSQLDNEQILQYTGLLFDYENMEKKDKEYYVKIGDRDYFRVQIYKRTLLQTRLQPENIPESGVLSFSRNSLIGAISKQETQENNEFLSFLKENTISLGQYPMYYIAPGI